ncbi:uncharacterized protein [Venturia canescens]|uniref:uncharacterized protein n=1 Tax=Venturia canescens TaxID=32260 RepID=UPI001C9BD80C|nr:uncharacterized protein LOC122407829 [Venturia canescens]XP_043270214.1 uncharacterized protein LOC122407829 [Venturia canescens]XP_043270223.1 uncharacterized protein LOC122407829 [Venturia canescens]
MYQFMVTTTRSGSSFVNGRTGNASLRGTTGAEISTMSLTSGTNKWASRFVVALQLAAWSAVGIVLLEKGIASLQKHSLVKDGSLRNNASQHQVTSRSSADVLSVIPLVPVETPTTAAASKASSDVSATRTISLWSSETTEVPGATKDSSSSVYDESAPGTQAASTSEKSTLEEGRLETGGEKINAITESRKNEQSRIFDDERKVKEASAGSVEGQGNDGPSHTSTETPTSPLTVKVVLANSEEPNGWSSSNRKRLRLAHVNGAGSGGAAAAVAMVAVGAVMLVLGPAVIVLRALDERRQERRFLKLSGEEDLPPSYEQATGDTEQAPTYSSLNLDTIS